ncbi:hypothetical protein EHQ71_10655 [Leptospira levettii]|uniref:hypothetical protein n=1 Tax=Leptospira levettii TaxID=2023178 RepID=UPI001083A2BE|nr:hypothetical protein [Leptospira levettii]TGM30477.1 hypothetical protein EHQ71_10655 [Leptospira levettii]
MKVFYSALLFLFSFHSLMAETLDRGKCEAYRKENETRYPTCLTDKKLHPCEVVKQAKSWREVLDILKGKGVIEDPSTFVEYSFDGENIEYTMTFEEGTMMAKKYGVRKIPGYIKMINENEVEYSLLKPLDGPCKGKTNKVTCSTMQSPIGPVLIIGFEGKPDICGIVTYFKIGLDEMESERTFTTKNAKKL